MKYVDFTNKQARQFLLLKHGLIGPYKFSNEQGVCDYIKQVGCIQFDPIDICGKNAELVLQSRVDGFSKELLFRLLYIDRQLLDYFDKNMSIFSIDDWKYFSRQRTAHELSGRSREQVNIVAEEIRTIIKEKGFVSSKDIRYKEKVDWSWDSTTLARAALETLYFRGELIIHHKKGTIKNYALAADHIAKEILLEKDPNISQEQYWEWMILRRVGAVGILWDMSSDAWLGIDGLKTAKRHNIFERLYAANQLTQVSVEDINCSFYCLAQDEPLVNMVLSNKDFKHRTEFIAPLDNLLWDRKLIKQIFNFDYKWEIYTPIDQRKYAYYTLPILWGNQFIGRIEIVKDKRFHQLIVKNIWFEDDIDTDKYKMDIHECIERFKKFNNCESVKFECGLSNKL